MSFEHHQIVRKGRCEVTRHVEDVQQEQREVMVSQPRYRPTVIGLLQAPRSAHRPLTAPVEAPARKAWTCFAGAQHLGRGVLSQSVPRAKSPLHTCSPSPLDSHPATLPRNPPTTWIRSN